MTLIILAAGYAVRLQPLTLNTSKSLLPIGNKLMIERILEKAGKVKGISATYVITNSKFFKNFGEWLKHSAYKDKVSIICDGTTSNETRLGAIRDMEFVIKAESIKDDILVVAGDNLFEFDLSDFLKFAKAKGGVAIALRDIGSLEAAKNFGVVAIDAGGKVIDFEEKPKSPKSTLISTGIYYFPKDKVAFIDEYVKMQNNLDAPGHYIGWLSKRDKVHGFTFLEDWYDIGNIESYRKANEDYLNKERKGNG